MGIKRAALQAAFPHTLPVLTGYIFLGTAFGVLLSSKGYSLGWAILMSTIIYAGAGQFVAISLLTSAFNPLYAFIITLVVNARHLFYGISLLNRLNGIGRKKSYVAFGLTDETFSILCSAEPPKGVDRSWFAFFIALLDHVYWVAGSVLGVLLGTLVDFNAKGIDFVMTALFVVIFIEQWKSQQYHGPAIIGIASSAVCLLVFGANNFIIPAMLAIVLVLSVCKKSLERRAVQ
ncbi:AzlC family ABC transporter permease [Sporomusa acidovorans]|uniref:Inner membrane protein YgaZ n=1 Tax=Sporomusa acidovorans (strain ATCC 49682 / DSM 3132 / Mol) TaxID=1123286 RepID=A0ABZ3JB79_SPOA4|nr:AzlC family ABC transporter permease [Sporomusa acidovorans]OZC13314.1 inner membrane protein YgaZ [Sporomusa acidovorans DSM 3132]SDD96911.1 4-azaleucine resistance probable transporter AzlC [Sporomusa acidovorans]